jgi:signal transduction histidine kinase
LDIRPEAPAELLKSAADTALPRARDKGITITVEAAGDLPRVAADSRRLARALDNLLDNAITYTDRGGRITLAAMAADHGVTLSVTDTGQGIGPEDLPHVFERFFRVAGQSRGGGTGLGLAIVREIVIAHGGSVSCDSTPGSGSVFRVELPIWSGHEPGPDGAGVSSELATKISS